MNISLQDRRRLLQKKAFSLLVSHVGLTVVGGGLSYILITWHIFEVTHSLNGILINASCFWVPGILLGPFVGVIVDRCSRKNVLLGTNLIRILAFAGIGIISATNLTPIYCYILTAINGATFAFAIPAFSAFLREIIIDEDLLLANTTIDLAFELANMVGMGLAGLAVLTLSFSAGLIACAALIAAGTVLLYFIKPQDLIPYAKDLSLGFTKNWQQAFNTLKLNPVLTLLAILQGLIFIQFMYTPLLTVPFVKNFLHAGSTVFSQLEITLCIGLIVGAFALPTLVKRWGFARIVSTGVAVMGATTIVLSCTHSVTQAILLFALLGASMTILSATMSRAQALTPKSQQGRVQSLINTMSALFILTLYLGLQSPLNHASISQEYLISTFFSLIELGLLVLIFKKQKTLI